MNPLLKQYQALSDKGNLRDVRQQATLIAALYEDTSSNGCTGRRGLKTTVAARADI